MWLIRKIHNLQSCFNRLGFMRSGLRKSLKVGLITLGSIVGLLFVAIAVLLWFVFTPSRLTPVVREAADSYLNAEVNIGKVDLVFFSTFPRFTLKIDDGELVAGTQDARDTLLSFSRCRITVNPVAYLKDNRVVVHRMFLDSVRVHLARDVDGNANWNIFPQSSDTAAMKEESAGGFSPDAILLRSFRIRGADVVFDDRSTELYAKLKDVDTRLRFGAGERGAAAGLDFSCGDLLFRQQGDLLVHNTAVSVRTAVGLNRDSMKVVLKDAELGINDIILSLNGTLRQDTVGRVMDVDLNYSAVAPSVEKALALIPESVVRHQDVTADGTVVLEGTVSGGYGKDVLPAVTMCLKIDSASAHYKGLPYGIDHLAADFDAYIDLMREKESYLDLKIFELQGNDIDVLADAKVTDLFEDPLIVLDTKARIDLASVAETFPLQDGIELSGEVDADLRVRTRLSTIRNQDFGRIMAAGRIYMDSLSVMDTASGLDAEGDVDLKFFGARALGVKGEITGLKFNSSKASAVADSLMLNVISTRPADTSRMFQVKADFEMSRLGASAGDSMKVFCGRGNASASIRPRPDYAGLPRIGVVVDTDTLFFKNGSMGGGLGKGIVRVTADKIRDSLWRPSVEVEFNRLGGGMGDSLHVFCMRGGLSASLKPQDPEENHPRLDLRIETDSIFAELGEIKGGMKKGVIELHADKIRDSLWVPSGKIRFNRLIARTPQCALPIRFNRTVIRFGDREINLKKAAIRIGRSNVVLSGTVYDLYGALRHGHMLRANLDVSSKNLNLNQLMRAFSSPDAGEQEIEADTVSTQMRLFEVPGNISFDLTTDIGRMRFGKYVFRNIKGKAELRDSHVYLENLSLNALDDAVLNASLIYKAASSKFGYAGFDINVHDIDIASLVDATPAIDSLVPMLQSFKGKVQMDVAAEGVLDSLLNIKIPSLRAAVYIRGDSLVLMDGQTFAEISKKLMFKNKEENLIDSISVNITVEDGSVNIYPFLVEIDRYQAAVGGVQNMDMSFDYHISILKSPLPFKAGLNIRGTLDDMRFGIGRAKYKNAVTPVETMRIDSLRLNLSEEIIRRFKSAGERRRWSDRAARRAGIDWEYRRDSLRRHHRMEFDGDSIQWERVRLKTMSEDSL